MALGVAGASVGTASAGVSDDGTTVGSSVGVSTGAAVSVVPGTAEVLLGTGVSVALLCSLGVKVGRKVGLLSADALSFLVQEATASPEATRTMVTTTSVTLALLSRCGDWNLVLLRN